MKVTSALILLVVLGIGSWWYFSAHNGGMNGELCVQVLTDARNPETGEVATFPTPCDVPEGWDILEANGNQTFTKDGAEFQRYFNADSGLSFAYRINPDGYTLIEHSPGEEVIDPTLEKHMTLFDIDEYQEALSATEPREGPPGITIMVFGNTEGLSAEKWLSEHARVANFMEGTEFETVSIGGAEGVRFLADGLYQNDVVILDNNSNIYLFSGAFNSPEDQIREDYIEFLNTVSLF